MNRSIPRASLSLAIGSMILAAASGCARPPDRSSAAGATSVAARSEVTFQTADGWTIHADATRPPNAKFAVVLLHQRDGSARDWDPLVAKLAAERLACLAVDQRGAGRSTGSANGENAPWDTGPDIAAAVAWLSARGFPPSQVALAGASYGANNALIYAAAHPEVKRVALLSPGTNYNGLQPVPAASRYRGELLILSARGDTITENGPQAIDRAAAGRHTLRLVDGSAHGADLFQSAPGTLDTLAHFFSEHR